jgi:hypothetical protein
VAGLDGEGAVIECDGGADMVGYSIKDVADLIAVAGAGFYDQVFFALADGFEAGAIKEEDAAG